MPPLERREAALLRLVAQGLVGPRRGSAQKVAERLLALQSQEFWSGLASLTARGGGRPPSAARAAFDDGELVRSWTLRGTLHVMAAKDLRWVLRLVAHRQFASATAREAQLGITADELDRARQLAVEQLTSCGPTSRARLTARWREGGLETSDQRSYRLIWHLAHDGVLCLGPVRAGEQLLVLVDDWIAASPVHEREEALGELARRYFDGHGPATLGDLKRWANLPVRYAKLAVSIARPALAALEIDGVEHLLGPSTQDELAGCRREARGVLALPGFDELLFGYANRSATLPERYAAEVLRPNGIGRSTIISGGRVIATWSRSRHGSGGDLGAIVPLESIAPRLHRAAAQRIAELTSAEPAD